MKKAVVLLALAYLFPFPLLQASEISEEEFTVGGPFEVEKGKLFNFLREELKGHSFEKFDPEEGVIETEPFLRERGRRRYRNRILVNVVEEGGGCLVRVRVPSEMRKDTLAPMVSSPPPPWREAKRDVRAERKLLKSVAGAFPHLTPEGEGASMGEGGETALPDSAGELGTLKREREKLLAAIKEIDGKIIEYVTSEKYGKEEKRLAGYKEKRRALIEKMKEIDKKILEKVLE